MNLKLEQYFVYESDKEITCDATQLFWGNPERKEIAFTHNEVICLFKARFNKIYPTNVAVFVEVLDTETGELLNFNCRKDMHEIMIKYMLYPPIIKNIFIL